MKSWDEMRKSAMAVHFIAYRRFGILFCDETGRRQVRLRRGHQEKETSK